jgi:hypothetical protein
MSVATPQESAEKELDGLKEQIRQIQKALVAERERARWSARVTAFVGTVMLLAVVCYFAYGYFRFREVTEPEKIVDVAQTLVDEQLPRARAELEQQIIKSAPQWAENLSRKAQESLPEGRKKLEEHVLKETESTLNEVEVLSEKQFREFLTKNRSTLERKYKELAASPELAEKSLQELEVPLDDAFQSEMRSVAQRVNRDLVAMNKNLTLLKERKALTPEQEVERQVWMIVRRLQLEYVDDTPRAGLVKKTPKPRAPTEKPKTPAKKTAEVKKKAKVAED